MTASTINESQGPVDAWLAWLPYFGAIKRDRVPIFALSPDRVSHIVAEMAKDMEG